MVGRFPDNLGPEMNRKQWAPVLTQVLSTAASADYATAEIVRITANPITVSQREIPTS